MKKMMILFGCLLVLTGCDMGKDMLNTPTRQVEVLLAKYQTLDSAVLNDLDKVAAEETLFNTNQREKYKEIMRKHYQNLIYQIKDEKIDGDSAIVTVQIEVTDYSRVMQEAEVYRTQNMSDFSDDFGNYVPSLFVDYRLNKMKEATDTIIYTIDFTLTKNTSGDWNVDPINSIANQKLSGIYNY